MQIIYHGFGCVRLQDGDVSVLIDPYDESCGLKIPKQQNDIVVYGNTEVKWKPVNKETFLVTEPGEYEVKKVFIYSYPVQNGLIHCFEFEGISIAHLGNLKSTQLTKEQLERFEDVDVVLVPVGGNEYLSAKQAQEVITELEPRIVIPICYAVSGLKVKLDDLAGFKKEVGGTVETVEKLKLNKKDLPVEETKFIIIEPSV